MSVSKLIGWGVCYPSETGPMIKTADASLPKHGNYALRNVPMIWGPHEKAEADRMCERLNAELADAGVEDVRVTVEPVAIITGEV